MSTELIIAIIVVAVLVLIALLVMLPRMRAAARRQQAERELESRRETVASQERAEAAERERQAETAEQKARVAQQEAERERAEANLRQEQAAMHDRGLADDELIDESERDRFAGVTGPDADADRDGSTGDDRARAASGSATGPETTGGPGTPAEETAEQGRSDYERGREDERRERRTDDVRESDRYRRG
jgi:type II secretory pathway pseudopilin PulG